MLEGVVPFPPEFAARYRGEGYWEDSRCAMSSPRSSRNSVRVLRSSIATGTITYAELDRLSDQSRAQSAGARLQAARPRRAAAAQRRRIRDPLLRAAEDRLPFRSRRWRRIATPKSASSCACRRRWPASIPSARAISNSRRWCARVREESPCCKYAIVLGKPAADELSLQALIDTPAKLPISELDKLNASIRPIPASSSSRAARPASRS